MQLVLFIDFLLQRKMQKTRNVFKLLNHFQITFVRFVLFVVFSHRKT